MPRTRFTIKKWEGDDIYSWALFEWGRPIMSGMSRSEAQFYKREAEKEAVTEEEIDGPTRFADEGPKEAQNAC